MHTHTTKLIMSWDILHINFGEPIYGNEMGHKNLKGHSMTYQNLLDRTKCLMDFKDIEDFENQRFERDLSADCNHLRWADTY